MNGCDCIPLCRSTKFNCHKEGKMTYICKIKKLNLDFTKGGALSVHVFGALKRSTAKSISMNYMVF